MDNRSYTNRIQSYEDREELMDIEITLLLEGLYLRYGYDFRHYARSSIKRRILYRMNIERISSVTALLHGVLHDSELTKRLLQDLSIRVTEMFRNPEFFLVFRKKVVPKLRNLPEIRIWHAGCSTGQEPLSMAILMQEENLLYKTKIYATDMNEVALRKAGTGFYPLSLLQQYTKNYMLAGGTGEFSNYYSTTNEEAHFHQDLLDHILFFQHNLVMDRSFNEFQVIICRNVLIYFDEVLQRRVHNLFYDSLSKEGYLGLGSNESLLYTNASNVYRTVDSEMRLFIKP